MLANPFLDFLVFAVLPACLIASVMLALDITLKK